MNHRIMGKAVITGLENHGPGDVLGLVDELTDVNPDNLGNIDIRDDYTVVEAPDAGKLADQLDGSKTNDDSKLGATVLDAKTKDYLEYVDKQVELIELEREEEIDRTLQEIRSTSGREREKRGRALVEMNARLDGESLGGVKVKFTKNNRGQPLPEIEISVGDVIMLSKNDPLRDDNPTGTVVQKTNYSVTAVFSEKPGSWALKGSVRVDLYVNDITFQRMREAVADFSTPRDESQKQQRDVITGLRSLGGSGPYHVDSWFNKNLNESQKNAVKRSLGEDRFHLVHGPPGTGKTTTGIEVIQQAVENGESVIAAADSNTAVDNILERLLQEGVDAVRVGHPARVSEKLKQNTLDAKVKSHENFKEADKVREKAFSKKEKLDDLTSPSGRYRRGMSDERIKQLADQGKGSRGVSSEKIQEMAEWIETKEEVDRLFEKAERLEDEAVREILDQADVICSTNSTAGSDVLKERVFDLAVVDECTQATEPSALIPVSKAEKAVLIGDHRQLPPTVKSREAEDMGFDRSLFEKLAERDEEAVSMLKTQYRMNTDIMEFASEEFYDERLVAAEKVADWDLNDEVSDESEEGVVNPRPVVQWLDTRELNATESSKKDSTSKMNQKEAEIASEKVEALIEAGVEPEKLAVIAPYDDQVELLEEEIGSSVVEINTVDGFQGREKDVVIISLTRSNQDNVIGFLSDRRRLNVSVTRAKKKLVVIGDSATVTTDETFENLYKYIEDRGEVIEL